MIDKRTVALIIFGIIVSAVWFMYTPRNASERNVGYLLNQRYVTNTGLNNLSKEMTDNPDLMIHLMNKLDKENIAGAKRVIAIRDSLTGLKDDHYMILKMFYSDNQ